MSELPQPSVKSHRRRRLAPLNPPQNEATPDIEAPAAPEAPQQESPPPDAESAQATSKRSRRRAQPTAEQPAEQQPLTNSRRARHDTNTADLAGYKPKPGDPDKKSVRKAFAQFDKDQSGYIDVEEFEIMLRVFGFGADAGQISRMVEKYDKDSSGAIDIEEFALMLQELRISAETALGEQWRRKQGSAVLIGGTVVGSEEAAIAVKDPNTHTPALAVLVVTLCGAVPAIACLCLYYVYDGASAPCSEDLGVWLLVNGSSGIAGQVVNLLLTCLG